MDTSVRLRPLYRREYDQLVELGVFEDEPIELLEGALVEMSPEGARHHWFIYQLVEHLMLSLPRRVMVRQAGPWAASDVSEPEPDVAIVPRARYDRHHPDTTLLLMEVAYSSLRKDLGVKAAVYAAAGVPEYWVVDLVHDVIHLHRDPGPDGYGRIDQHGFDDTLQVEGVPVRLTDLLEG